MTRARDIALLFILFVLYVTGTLYFVGFPASSDLRAVWLAGQFFDPARPEAIYAMSGGVFTMEPPAEWIALTQAEGRETSVFPFIYPPLWAWLAQRAHGVADWGDVVRVATVANVLMVPACLFLAWRILGRPGRFVTWAAIALPVLVTTITFLMPIEENQPQILVSFLILLGIERQRAGQDIAGGAALALAAAIKLYPAIFALLWLAAGQRRAAAAFALVGGALGLVSLSVAGWPMHWAMLGELRAISSTVLLSLSSFSADTVFAALALGPENMTRVSTEATGGVALWWVAEKGAAWSLATTALQVAVLAGLLVLARRTRMAAATLWPVVIIAVAWVSPLAWTYHYIPALVFTPLFVQRYGAPGALAVFAVFAAVFYPFATSGLFGAIGGQSVVLMGSAGLGLALVLFARLAWEPKARPRTPNRARDLA